MTDYLEGMYEELQERAYQHLVKKGVFQKESFKKIATKADFLNKKVEKYQTQNGKVIVFDSLTDMGLDT